MQRCSVCNGRTVKTETGSRCMNSACEGAKEAAGDNAVQCACGETMVYSGLALYGEPNYNCTACGANAKL